jgi:hypothetical protein
MIGKTITAKTLAATFFVPGAKLTKISGFTTKIKGGQKLFIEQPKYRLSKPTEVKEIQFFKAMKGGK